jgi:hypothetical protein
MSESGTGRQSRHHDILDGGRVAWVTRNIAGTFDFVRAVMDDPSLFDHVPDGAQLVLVYDDDPALSELHLRAAAEIERQGGTVYVHHVKR